MQVRAKKNLGQHFLKDEEIARRISETISAEQLPAASAAYGSLPILEIGPGMGMMTKYLMNTGRELTAVELDHESVEYLDKIYPGLNVVEGDFLKMDLEEIYSGPFALIGNYPYNISSQIFSRFLITRKKSRLWQACFKRKWQRGYAPDRVLKYTAYCPYCCRHGTTANISST